MSRKDLSRRAYHSPVRAAAALERRERILVAACELLGEIDNVNAFTLEAVATAAGVTRLTLYNQFGSRRALMEAAFDHVAAALRSENLSDIAMADDPKAALRAIVASFCRFWRNPAVMRLQDAVGSDPEFDQALAARHERRRQHLEGIARRAAPEKSAAVRRDAADSLFALTSPQMYQLLARNRSPEAACQLVFQLSLDVLERLCTR
jgi:AcrR family transcriptional regulator